MKDYFEEKMFIEYARTLDICLVILLFDTFMGEFIIWVDVLVKEKFHSMRFINFAYALLIVVLFSVKQLRNNRGWFKIVLVVTLITRHLIFVIELFITIYTSLLTPIEMTVRTSQVAYSITFIAMINSTIVVSNGILRFKEAAGVIIFCCMIPIVTLLYFKPSNFFSLGFTSLTIIVYSLIDSWRINDTEQRSFFRIVNTKKKTVYLSRFVDRLLPKHVGSRSNGRFKKLTEQKT